MTITECQNRKNINVHSLLVTTEIATDMPLVLQKHVESLLYKLMFEEGIRKMESREWCHEKITIIAMRTAKT